LGHKSSKVTASHIEDIQKTIEMQIEKTPVLGTTVVKILLTPDNIGDIHVQLIKKKDSITAVLQVQDAETKGLLEDQLPLLMEPFKHSVSQGQLTLTVVADPSLAFSFSEGADPGQRKMERQESRKRTAKEKTETKQKSNDEPVIKRAERIGIKRR
jgi:flagellar hook-length control protein FliK